MRGSDQFMQDAALTGAMAFAAASAQGEQLLLQRAYAVQAGLDAFELGIDQMVDVAAVGVRMGDENSMSLFLFSSLSKRPEQ